MRRGWLTRLHTRSIGPVDLTEDTVSGVTTVPTVTDNLFSQGLISTHEVAVSFEPTTSDSVTNGELTWGGTDSSKFTGAITFTYFYCHIVYLLVLIIMNPDR
jgi:hypothetical protein